MNEPFFLGTGKRLISPKVGCRLSGYAPDVYSESLNDDLNATAYFFRQGALSALMVSVTVCSIKTSLADDIRAMIEAEYGIPQDNCILHAIHNHSGPIVNGSFGWGDLDVEYAKSIMIPGILAAVKDAIDTAIPVQMKVSVGESLVGINRRELTVENKITLGQNPWGPFDPKMTVISFANETGVDVANLIHYGCHGTASGRNHEISRD